MHRPNDLKIKKFGLHYGRDTYLDRVDDWILNVLEFYVKEIDLWFRFREMFVLMDEVFLCTGLEKLQLSRKIVVDRIPEDVKFSSLWVLKFDKITCSSYESVGELLIKGCCLSISGSALKKFKLVSYSPIDDEFSLKILIDTTGLETLSPKSFASDDILIKKNLPFLTSTRLNVDQIVEGVAPSSVFGDSVLGLLKKITHVKYLKLGGKTVEVSVLPKS
ncbi:F-box/LRR-repeat protein At4g14096-like [Apium graveolens]|uniref:F-box/LRR-repeat protein At4g14096-like n=1 Tax=Apium graveolens TaxID=4045 RepID=UPI003D7972F4